MSDFYNTQFEFAGDFGPLGRSENYHLAMPSWEDEQMEAELVLTGNTLTIE